MVVIFDVSVTSINIQTQRRTFSMREMKIGLISASTTVQITKGAYSNEE